MVNLAKLRKKAKEKKEKKEPAAPAPEAAERELAVPEVQEAAPAPADRIAAYLATAGEAQVAVKASGGEADAAPQLELLTFVMAGEHYAIDIDEVVEIVTPRPVTRVPNADPSVVGIFSLRGTVVTLMDAQACLGHDGLASAGPDTRVIVVRHDSETVGFLVDRVLRVIRTDRESVAPQPVVHSSEHDESVRGVFRHGEQLTIVLDLGKLLFTAWN
jgi:purine-binding chemotaxis protein CheW